MPAVWTPSLTSLTKGILVIRGTGTLLIAAGAVLMGLGQVAALPPSRPLDLREAANGPMHLVEESRAIEGQQNTERLPAGLHDTLQAVDELAAALSTANHKFEALAGAARVLHRRLEATRQQRDHLSATLVDVQRKLRVRERRENELAGRVVALGKEARQSEAQIARLNLELEASEQRRQQLEGVGEEVAQLKDELLSLRQLLERADVALAQAQHERDAARAETEVLRAEITALLTTALASLQQKDQPFESPPNTRLAPGGNIVEAPMESSPEAQDRR
jgi:chromosome segregation ATPase